MVSQKVMVTNPSGLHLQPAGEMCSIASSFHCRITLRNGGCDSDAKSVLSVLGACVKSGDEITLFCDGEDEEKALKTLVEAIENGLGE